ncbi:MULTISPECIES: carbohydrate kinase family protein [Streptomyces]|uniref:carbohydrate kinase family protein n=1 Tax=Streptomyces TaxID=1883 RepID=UPI00067E0F8B|nr:MULTISPECIES: PfkB family carbohydrate kinase [Streptomyces]MDX3610378.1 PfkB family carbohydrate kinase [Streptomyces sp. FL06-04B]MDX3738454.1 PfkB family carbohydrate kinase [Streptomyces sp. ID01-15D]
MDGHGLGRRVSRPEAGRGLLVVGDVVTDVVARHGSALAHGTDTKARIRTLPGGAGANVACWAVRSGCPDVRLLARAGAESADWHREVLETAGVRAFLAVDDEVPTATVVALVDAAAERTFLTDGGAVLRLAVEDFAPTMLDGVGRLHLSGYLLFAAVSRAAALLALRTAVERGVPVSVDPASAGFLGELGPKRFLEFAEGAQLLLPNADEARLLTGLPEPGAAAAELSRRFPRVVVTLGARGAVVAAGGEVVGRVPAPPVPEPVDSTGAGDAFTGGFLAALLAGADEVTAAAEGCRAGASAVAAVGGRPPVR